MTSPARLQIVTDNEASDIFPAPPEGQFGDLDFLPDAALAEVGNALIRAKFPDIDGAVVIDFLWKKKGGHSKGHATLGKCIKLTGLTSHYAQGAMYAIWCAADYADLFRLTRYQVEALLFHELCHIEREEPEDEDKPVKWSVKGHDVEAFRDEITEYGLWKSDLVAFNKAIETAQERLLPGFEARL